VSSKSPTDKSGCSKAQSSIEFIIIFALLLLILVIGATAASVRIYGISIANKELEVSKVLDEVSGKLNLAFLEGDGFRIEMTVPKKILSQNYTINIYKNNIVLWFENSTYSSLLMTENITGSLEKGLNILTNVDGGIVII